MNKDKIIGNLHETLGYDDEKSNEIYETAIDIFGEEIKNKLKHPCKSQVKKGEIIMGKDKIVEKADEINEKIADEAKKVEEFYAVNY